MPRPLTLLMLVSALAMAGCATAPRSAAGPAKQTYKPAELFSPVVRSGSLLFLAGVIGTDGEDPSLQGQTRRVLEKIRERLGFAGATLDDVVKCTVLLADIADYDAMNAVYKTFWTRDPPARTAVAVAGLPAQARVEIECIAAAR